MWVVVTLIVEKTIKLELRTRERIVYDVIKIGQSEGHRVKMSKFYF